MISLALAAAAAVAAGKRRCGPERRRQQPLALAPAWRERADARVAVNARGDATAAGADLMALAEGTRPQSRAAASGGGGIRSRRVRIRSSVFAEEVGSAAPSSPGGRSTPPWSP